MAIIGNDYHKTLRDPFNTEGGGSSTANNTEVTSTVNTTTTSVDSNNTVVDELPDLPPEGKVPITSALKKQEGKLGDDKPKFDPNEPIGDLDDLDDKGVVKTELKIGEEDNKDKEGITAPDKDSQQQQNLQNQQQQTQPQQAKRDYSEFSPEDAEILKKCPNHIYDALKERFKAVKQQQEELTRLKTEVIPNLEKGIVKMPDSYAEHPDAYTLAPEYTQYRIGLQDAREEEEHWKNQLIKIERGEPWQDIEGRDPKTGKLVLSEPINSEGDELITHKIAINNAMQEAAKYRQHFQGQIAHLKQNHVNAWKQAVISINEECKKHFPWITNEKLMEEKIEVEIGKPPIPIREALRGALSIIDPRFRNHPMSIVTGHLIVANLIASQKIRAYEAQMKVANKIQQDSITAEPGSSGKAGGARKLNDSSNLSGIIGSLSDLDE